MKRLLGFLILAALSFAAVADAGKSEVYRNLNPRGESVVIRIYMDEPCKVDRVINAVIEKYRSYLRKADLTWEGKNFAACWLNEPSLSNVLMMDEEGDEFNPPQGLPRSDFKDESI